MNRLPPITLPPLPPAPPGGAPPVPPATWATVEKVMEQADAARGGPADWRDDSRRLLAIALQRSGLHADGAWAWARRAPVRAMLYLWRTGRRHQLDEEAP
jgi:hypothetical protein